jgi:6-phosphogluconolactonase
MENGLYRIYASLFNSPNAIGVLEIEQASGALRLLQNAPIRGKRPRGLGISPDGLWVLSGCLVSGDIASYRVKDDGRLDETGYGVSIPGVSYINFDSRY